MMAVVIQYGRKPLSYKSVADAISTYQNVYTIERLTKGEAFQNTDSLEISKALFQYAPLRMLIVERDDMAEMLILNRFHLENQTLVVSARKYPRHAFAAFQQFLSHHPNIPIILMHDASETGIRMKRQVIADSTWNLGGKDVKDLGLFPQDVRRMKTPMWLPPLPVIRSGKGKILSNKAYEKNIRQGYRMPLDMVPSKAMMGIMGFAVAGEMALLSEEFLAEQTRTSGSIGGGFG